MNTSPHPRLHQPTQLFTIRLWVETLGEGQGEVRMQVQHVRSGETYYFRAWPPLITYILAKLQEMENVAPSNEADL
jgi:hypothetical protein